MAAPAVRAVVVARLAEWEEQALAVAAVATPAVAAAAY